MEMHKCSLSHSGWWHGTTHHQGTTPHPASITVESQVTRKFLVARPIPRAAFFVPKCRQRFSVLENTLLEGSAVEKVLWCAFPWCSDVGPSQCTAMLGLSCDFITTWHNQWRLTCGYAKERDRPKLGVPGTIVNMDCAESGRF